MPRGLLYRPKEALRPYYLRWLYFLLHPEVRPNQFTDCWQYPSHLLDRANLLTHLPAHQRQPGFLFLPMNDWHSRRQRTQHLALALANLGHCSFLLNPHLGRQFDSVYLRDRKPRFSLLRSRVIEVHVRIPHEPVYHHRLLRNSETRILASTLAQLAAAESDLMVQMVSLPTWLDAALELRRERGWPIVYDCHDLLRGFHSIAPDVIRAEERLLQEADAVLFTSPYLQRHLVGCVAGVAEKSFVLRNATDNFHFNKGAEQRGERPRVSAHQRIVGYFGSLDEWFDVESVRHAAHRHPNWRFQLIGRIESAKIQTLVQLPNIELLGEIDYFRLPDFLAQFDVAVIPFLLQELTLATNPIKLYEYFSSGIPVVSSRLPEVEQFHDLVYLSDGPADFALQLQRAMEENSPSLRARRMEVARRETWDARAAWLLQSVTALNEGRLAGARISSP